MFLVSGTPTWWPRGCLAACTTLSYRSFVDAGEAKVDARALLLAASGLSRSSSCANRVSGRRSLGLSDRTGRAGGGEGAKASVTVCEQYQWTTVGVAMGVEGKECVAVVKREVV